MSDCSATSRSQPAPAWTSCCAVGWVRDSGSENEARASASATTLAAERGPDRRLNMSIRTTSLAALVAAGLAAGCAGHTHYDPFLVPQARIYGSVKTIALAPITAPDELGGGDLKRGKFDTLLAAQLREAGFTVVPAEASAAIWKHVTDSLGGLFDATTGARDTVTLNVARATAMAEL